MTKPRIAHVISGAHSVGGAERVVASLVKEGAARGYPQVVLNPFSIGSSTAFQDLCGEVQYQSRDCDRAWQLPSLRYWLRKQLRSFRPDIVHTHLFHASVAVASISRQENEFRILTHHHGDVLSMKPHPRIRQGLDNRAGRRFDRVVAVSESVGRYLTESYGYPASKVTCILNGWVGNPVPTCRRHAEPTVVCVGNFRSEKGQTILLSAFKTVLGRRPDARLVLVGEGVLYSQLVAQARDDGLTDNVEFAGSVENVWPHLHNADVFASASLSEPFGIVIIEAMAAGLPVVAPATGGIPELITPDVNGLLFPPGDADRLAAHLIDLLESPESRARMGEAARVFAQQFRMETTVARYFELYDSVRRARTCPAADAR